MKTFILGFAALLWTVFTREAVADIEITKIDVYLNQPSTTGHMTAGMTVEASTLAPVMTTGAGFTLTCQTSTPTPLNWQNVQTASGFFGVNMVVKVPPAGSVTTSIPGWSSIPTTTCADCVLEWKVEANDLSGISVTMLGLGFGIQLFPSQVARQVGTKIDELCRGGEPQCCGAGCSLP